MSENDSIATHQEVLEILSAQARAGSISAAIALERALRAAGKDEPNLDDEIDRILGNE